MENRNYFAFIVLGLALIIYIKDNPNLNLYVIGLFISYHFNSINLSSFNYFNIIALINQCCQDFVYLWNLEKMKNFY